VPRFQPSLKKRNMGITPKDILALIIVIGGFYLIATGVDSFIQLVLALVVGYYFGRRLDLEEQLKK